MKTNNSLLMSAALLAMAMSSFGQPDITQQPTNQMPYVGSTATFSVAASGSPTPTYQWRFNGTELLDKTNTSLSLVNVQFTNAGPYSVVVSNDGGSFTSQVAWLSVLPTNVVNLGDLELRFGVPTNLTSLNSSYLEDESSISTDGLTIFFESDRPGGSGLVDIWTSTRPTAASPWGAPVNLGAPVNSASDDGSPRISPDGLSLYFGSFRAGGAGSGDIWVATRPTPTDPFGAPVNLGPEVNSASEEFGPSITADGLTLLFSAIDRPGGLGGGDIWISTRTNSTAPWEPARNLGAPVNTSYYDVFPCLSTDGLLLFFMSDRANPGTGNAWVAKRATTASPFGPPVRIRAIAEPTVRARPHAISADGTTLYFGSDRSGGLGNWDLWQISVTRLPALTALGVSANGEFQFELLGRAGATYDIEVSPDFSTWTPWVRTNTSDRVELSDPASAPEGHRFYRALSH
ncbi:MAG: PD40 domain-containing protein [Verrucomicrobia bacterium]|nr:PD40 domain-containing protein [Verrucomicrobiota bacterium]